PSLLLRDMLIWNNPCGAPKPLAPGRPAHPQGGSASTKKPLALGLGRQPAGLAGPALDAAPAPHVGATQLPEGLREAGAAREHVHALRGDPQPPRDIDRDHELRPRIDEHGSRVDLARAAVLAN